MSGKIQFELYSVTLKSTDTVSFSSPLFIEIVTLDFADQVESWDELKDFTWQELEDFLNDPSIPERIERKLGGYKVDEDDVYSNEVSEVAHELLAIHLAKKKGKEKGNDKKTIS